MTGISSKKLLFSALTWIEKKKNDENVDKENVEVGIECLSQAFGLNVHDPEQKKQFGLDTSFDEIFTAGLKALGFETKSSVDQDPVVLKNPDLWKKWVAKLEDKGFFKDAPVGSEEHLKRTEKALIKFKEKFGSEAKNSPASPATPCLSKEEREAKGEELKGQGNTALSAGDYVKAADLYKQAISFSSDGPNSHIYYSNHAAALMYLGKFNEVIDNCEKSIALKPSYSKAYSRMGAAQIQLKDYDGAIETFRRGLEVDPSNDACKDGLAEAEHKLRASSAPATRSTGAGAGPASGGMPDLGGLASMLGGAGGGGLADLMNNPAMRQMAQNMMQNPAMMQMAQNMMQNPDALNSMMNGLGSLGGGLGGVGAGAPGASAGGAGGMPDIASMMNNFRNSPEVLAARNDPDLQDFFNDVDREGPSAAMRHMSNPKVSQLLQSIMGRVG